MNKLVRIFSRLFERVSTQDRINFARHLSIVIKVGLPILEGLRIIKKQTTSKTLRYIIEEAIIDINNGQFLATSLSHHPAVFNDFFINIVRVGEASGTLATNLSYLAEELKKSNDLRNKIRSAMIYPLIVLIATIILVSFLVFFAFPKILPIFAGLHVRLPLPTRILIFSAEFFVANWAYILGGLVIFIITARILLLAHPIKWFFHRLLFFLPVFSRLTIDINMANFTRVLAVLLKGGIKIVEAVTITAKTFDNLVYREALIHAAEEVRKGEQFASYLAQRKNIFPTLLSGLIEIGENTGNLEENLVYLSEYYRDEAELSVKNLTILLEPALLLTMGIIVGFVAISIITPIYQISQSVQ